jgi:hypothetical protein
MAEEKPDTVQATATAADPGLLAAFSGPAPMANKIYLTISPVTGRLAFVEFPPDVDGGPPHFRAAVTLTINDLIALQKLLNDNLKDVKQLPVEGGAANAAKQGA